MSVAGLSSRRYTGTEKGTINVSTKILRAARELGEEVVSWRRYLHEHPELSGEETQTAAFVAERLAGMGLDPETGLGGTHGVSATIAAGVADAAAPTVALRADMDALPVQEETGLPYASRTPGVMHACGHDAHTAMLLGAARVLCDRRDALRCHVRLIFQPHEEKIPGGAQPLIEAGVLDGVACVFGIHIWSQMPVGTLGTRVGAFMSGVTDVGITIRGEGGHAAMPEECRDPVVAAAQVVVALQTSVSRSISMSESGVLSITRITGGTADNVIPEVVRLGGTIRALNDATRARIASRTREISEGVAAAHGTVAQVELREGYPALVNDGQVVEAVLATARRLGVREADMFTLPAQGGGEDFAYYCQQVPGAFVFVGARNEGKGCCYPHHHPQFAIDEEALPLGVALLAQFAMDAYAG